MNRTSSNVRSGFRNLVDALAAAPPDRPFITFWIDEDERQTLTFGQFRARAAMQTEFLRSHGVNRGDRVIVIMPQGLAAMTTFAGAMMIGAVPAFLAYPNFKIEPGKYRDGLAGVTANLTAKVVVIDQEFPEELLAHIAVDSQTTVLRAGEQGAEVAPATLLSIERGSDDLAFIQHSAGTTGLQKGVALTHGAVLRQIEHLASALKIDGAKDCIYSWLPLYHDMGLIACFMLPMVCHVPVVMQSPMDWVVHPETTLELVTEFGCTLAWMPNFALQFIPRRARKERWANYDLSSLRALINCSEPVRYDSLRVFYEAFSGIGLRRDAIQSSYAMAENVFAITQSGTGPVEEPALIWADGEKFRNDHRIRRASSADTGAIPFTSSGRLLPGNELRIVSEQGAALADGDVGEILLRSDTLFSGYFNRPDLTAIAIADGWYRTGDLGFFLEGELFVVGRKKDLLIVGGENLYPQDIEEIAGHHPGIHDGRVVAMGVFNPEVGTEEIVVVAEVEKPEVLANPDAVQAEIRRLIVEGIGVSVREIFLKPPRWIVKSTAGKAARSATRQKLLEEHPELCVESREAHSA
jgi:acyl-CoA synthetase (AMP-forming)/AMP-acid ligase II